MRKRNGKTNGHGIGHNSGTIRLHRKYNDVTHDPDMDEVVSVLAREGLSDGKAATLSGVGARTISNWRTRKTKRPQHNKLAATLAGIGFKFTITRVEKLDYDSELPKAKAWLKRREAMRAQQK